MGGHTQGGDIEAAVQRLISPTGMGELFKAMAVALAEPSTNNSLRIVVFAGFIWEER